MNTTIDLKTAKTIEAMNQKINHMDNAVTDFFNKMSDVLERQLGDDEVYAAVIAPEVELTITPLANVRSYLPCFDEADSCYSISEDVPLALCYDPRQVITLAGKRYLSGAVVFVRYDTNGSFVALTAPPQEDVLAAAKELLSQQFQNLRVLNSQPPALAKHTKGDLHSIEQISERMLSTPTESSVEFMVAELDDALQSLMFRWNICYERYSSFRLSDNEKKKIDLIIQTGIDFLQKKKEVPL